MTGLPISTVVGCASDPGLKRELNEDGFLAQAPCFLVADGMGGYEAGEVASATVIDEFSQVAGLPFVDLETVKGLVARAKSRIEGLLPGAGAGAGTTLTGAFVAEHAGAGYWLVINLGDSRTYRFAQGRLEQISVDHSVVQEMIEEGALTEESARVDRRRNVVTRAIGAGADSEPDYWLLPAAKGDRILVCSDGLTGELSPGRIAELLALDTDPQEVATSLVHEAMLAGGRDNITAVVVDAVDVALGSGELSGTDGKDEDEDDTVPRVAEKGSP